MVKLDQVTKRSKAMDIIRTGDVAEVDRKHNLDGDGGRERPRFGAAVTIAARSFEY